jgi:hypothetical protein
MIERKARVTVCDCFLLSRRGNSAVRCQGDGNSHGRMILSRPVIRVTEDGPLRLRENFDLPTLSFYRARQHVHIV